METQLLVALVGLLGALTGSAVGGTISFLSSRAVRRLDHRQSSLQKDREAREALYADFLAEASRLMLLSLRPGGTVDLTDEVTRLVALEARIWFYSDELGDLARTITKIVLFEFRGVDSAVTKERNEEEQKAFARHRDKFIQECKLDLAKLRTEA